MALIKNSTKNIGILKKLGIEFRKIDVERMAERLIDVWFGPRGYGSHHQYGAIGYNIIDGKFEYFCFDEYKEGKNWVKEGVFKKEWVELVKYDANNFKKMCHGCKGCANNEEKIVDKYQLRECRVYNLYFWLEFVFKPDGYCHENYEYTQYEEEIIEELLKLKQKQTELLKKVIK